MLLFVLPHKGRMLVVTRVEPIPMTLCDVSSHSNSCKNSVCVIAVDTENIDISNHVLLAQVAYSLCLKSCFLVVLLRMGGSKS